MTAGPIFVIHEAKACEETSRMQALKQRTENVRKYIFASRQNEN
jgi:F0F1-type ATP synthase gamma subunit